MRGFDSSIDGHDNNIICHHGIWAEIIAIIYSVYGLP